MENSNKKALLRRTKRSLRVRSSLKGSRTKPRLCVVKTNKHIYAQLIDDVNHVTLASVSTVSKELRETEHVRRSKETAQVLGSLLAKKANTLGIQQVIFDRGPFKFHGILKELADSARSSGLVV